MILRHKGFLHPAASWLGTADLACGELQLARHFLKPCRVRTTPNFVTARGRLMKAGIDMGVASSAPGGQSALLDLEELLATRLLVQGDSGSGKSHLLRRLLEQSANLVQQAIIDPEGDFVTLADKFGHVVVAAAEHSENEIVRLATRIREHRVSVILALDELEIEQQMRCAATFLSAL